MVTVTLPQLTELTTSGGSDVLIRVTQRISGNASGGSDVRYYGDPRDIDVNTSGSADVRRP